MPALIFDCDGVLADTEQEGHLRAFNQTFSEFGLPVQWSVEDYAEKVKIGGGKERLRSLLTPGFVHQIGMSLDPDTQQGTVADWHRRKTEIYTELINSGLMPARPGIRRIITEAAEAGWTLAVASTSARPSVEAVLTHAVGPDLASRFTLFVGDVVPRKKPAPDIYLLALDELGIGADDAVVVEDSQNGHRAAIAAGLRTVVTISTLTAEEDFTGASLVVTCLGDPAGEPARVVEDPLGIAPGETITLAMLEQVLAQPRPETSAGIGAGATSTR
jgi:HAD superfamily hydrolase (TIGR01509 family)